MTVRVLWGAVFGAIILGTGVAACGQEPDPVEQLPPPAVSTTAPTTEVPAAPVPPFSLAIPAIGVDQVLEPVGLTPARQLQIPPVDAPEVLGWYAGRNTVKAGDECMPGATCSAVVVGHVNGTGPNGERGWPGVFERLNELVPGAEVIVERADGSELRFVVETVESVDKDELPRDIYTLEDRPRLNLVTCDDEGGFGTERAGHYDRNVLVRTVLS